MKLQTSSLRSKVAQRIFLLFVTCALVPIGALTILSFYEVSGQLRAQSRAQLEQAAKSQGMSTFERLEMLDAELQVVALQAGAREVLVAEKDLGGRFLNVRLLQGTPEPGTSQGISPPRLTLDQTMHLNSGKALVITRPCSPGSQTCIYMLRLLNARRPEEGTIAGEINPEYLWGADRVSAGLTICVFEVNISPLLCSMDGLAPSIENNLPSQSNASSGFLRWASKRTEYDTAYWSLFLNPQFHTGAWTFALSQPHADALAPMERFRNLFPFVVLLALWVVILLSLVQIRRTLVPLEKLKDGTNQIRDHNFESRVKVHSGDEFEDLAISFNSMTLQLGRQFHALKTINEIDQAILQSLDRRGIVDGVFKHLPNLLRASSFGVAMFDNSLTVAELTFTTNRSNRESDRQILITDLSSSDLQDLHWNPHVLATKEGDRTPDFLLPLSEHGMSSFLILPIFLEAKPFAALVCAQDAPAKLAEDDIGYARQVADQLAVAFSNVQLIEALGQFHWGTLTALARAIDAKSAWTAGHSERVTAMAIRIARHIGLDAKELQTMQRGGLLHDIGKIGTPQTILDKPGKLDSDEMQIMRDHVRVGLRILEPIPAFKEALPIVAQHHEWFNGKGYPEGLAGEAISLHARIFAVADFYDALTSDRPYRKGLPKAKVVDMLREGSGIQFDPRVVEAYLQICRAEDSEAFHASPPIAASHAV